MRYTLIVLFGVLVLAACGPEEATDRERGMDRDRMGPGMMMGMMERMPEGIPASALPDPASEEAQLVVRYCSPCHGIPTPKRLSAAEWPATLDRMFARMERMDGMMMGEVEAPSAEERERILGYLQAHALQVASEEDLGDDPAARLFARTCSRCHALPDPAQHTPDEWVGVVARMRQNMRRMDVEGIADEEARRIIRYLQRASAERAGSTAPTR